VVSLAVRSDDDLRAYETGLSSTCLHRPRLLAEISGLITQIAAVLVPRRAISRACGPSGATAARVCRSRAGTEFVDTVLCALDHRISRQGDTPPYRTGAHPRDAAEVVTDVWTVNGAAVARGVTKGGERAMDFRFGAARDLYRAPSASAGLFRLRGPAEARRKSAGGRRKTIAEAFRDRSSPTVRAILGIPSLRSGERAPTGQKPGYGGIEAAFHMAALAVIEEDEEALEAAPACSGEGSRAEEDPPADRQPRHRLGCYGGGTLGLAYDLIQPWLRADERRDFCRWVYRRGVRMTLDSLLPRYFLNAGPEHPDDRSAERIPGLMAIDGDPGVPALAREWERALPMLEATVSTALGPAGYPEEDMGYGTLMVARLAQVVEPLRRAGNLRRVCSGAAIRGVRPGDVAPGQPWGEHLSTNGRSWRRFRQPGVRLGRQAAERGDPTLLWLLQTLCCPSFPPIGDIELSGKRPRREFRLLAPAGAGVPACGSSCPRPASTDSSFCARGAAW